jgi:hypothetical protein
VTVNETADPGVNVSAPVFPSTPAVPLKTKLPVLGTVQIVGLTLILEKKIVDGLSTDTDDTVNVIVLAVGVAPDADNTSFVPCPVTNAITFSLVLNSNPAGAVIIIVPAPTSPAAPSTITGPVNVVQEALHVSAEIAFPPVAAVMLTAALTKFAPTANTKSKTVKIDKNFFIF